MALDVPLDQALALARTLKPVIHAVKVGSALLISGGPNIVRQINREGVPVLLDLNLHDTPDAVAKAVFAAYRLKVWAITIRVSGDLKMMRAARAALRPIRRIARPLIIGVTVPTSSDVDDLHRDGIPSDVPNLVRRMTTLAMVAKLDGLICPPAEVAAVRTMVAPEIQLMVSGIRLLRQSNDDHKQVGRPREVMEAGADWLVIGRPIYATKDPRQAAKRILAALA